MKSLYPVKHPIFLLAALLFLAPVALAQWTTATLSEARSELAATSVGGKVLFAGGSPGGAVSNVVDIYDAGTNTWSTATLSQARYYLAAASAGGKAFFAGGDNLSSASNVVDIYNASDGTWSTATLSRSRGAPTAASAGGKILFGGGFGSSGPSNVVDIYDVATGFWSTSALSQGRARLTATSVGSKVIFGGGFTFGASNIVDIYDTVSGIWTIATLSEARYNLAATSAGGKVFFAGGRTDDGNRSSVVDIYDEASGTWTTATLSQAREQLVATSMGGKVFFAGGYTGIAGTFVSNVVDVYDTATGLWSTSTLSQARYNLAAASLGDKAFFGGGNTNGGPSNVVDIYSNAQPTTLTQQPSPAAQTVCPGGSASSTVTATGDNLGYQWYKNEPDTDEPVSGQNTATLSLSNVQPADAGLYYCRVSGDGGVVWSEAFTLTVNPTPAPPTAPANQTVCTNQGIHEFSITLNGPGSGGDELQISDNDPMFTGGVSTSGPFPVTLGFTLVAGETRTIYLRSRNILTNCMSSVVSFTLTHTISPNTPSITTPNGFKICEGATLQYIGNPGLAPGRTLSSFVWSSNNPRVTVDNTGLLTGLTPVAAVEGGNIFYDITDNLGCTSRAIDGFQFFPKPTGSLSLSTTPICEGQSSTLNVTLNVTPFTQGQLYDFSYSEGSTITTLTNQFYDFNTAPIPITVNPSSSKTYSLTSITNLFTTCQNTSPGSSVTLTVNPLPLGSNGTATVCSGTALNVDLQARIGNSVPSNFTWTVVDNSTVTGEAAGSGDFITQTLASSSNTPQTVTYTVTPTSETGACVGASFTVTVTVNPLPVGSNGTAPVCSGLALNVDLQTQITNGVPSNFTWTVVDNPSVSGEVAGIGDFITQTLINSTGTNQTVVYTITPTAEVGGCVGNPFTITLMVRPTPAGSNGTAAVCSGTALNVDLQAQITNSVASNFTWTVADNPSVSNEAAGSGDFITQTLTSSSNTPQMVTYTVTPTSETGGCVGATFTVTVTVNPVPVGSNGTAPVCAGLALNVDLQTQITNGVPSNFTWTVVDNPSVSGEVAGSGDFITQTLINSTGTNQTVVYTITPTAEVGGCVGNPFTITVMVRPTPAGSNGTAAVCSGTALNVDLQAQITNSVASNFTWTVADNPSVSNEAAGSGDFITQTLTSSSNTPQMVTYTVTPTSETGGCVGATFTVTVTVNPVPVGSNGTASVCAGLLLSVPLQPRITNAVPSSFAWTVADNPNVGGESAGSGFSLNQTLTNTTANPQTVTYTVTPTSPDGPCAGATFTVTVTVNPLPSDRIIGFTSGATPRLTACTGSPEQARVRNTQTGISYALFIAGNPTALQTITGDGATVSFPTALSTAGTYSVVATNPTTGCTATLSTTLTVYTTPGSPSISTPGNQTVCAATSQNFTLTVSPGTGANQVEYTLTDFNDPPTVLSGSFPQTITISVAPGTTQRVRFRSAISGSTCTSGTIDRNRTVNALPTAFSVTGGGSYCASGTGVAIGLGGSQTGVNYQVQNSGVNVGSAVAGTGSALNFGMFTTVGTYTVVATNPTTTCTATMTGSVTVTVNPLPAAPTNPVNQTSCQSQPIPALSVSVGSGETVDWYSASSGGTPLLSGSTSYTPPAAGTYFAQTRNTTTGCLSATRRAVTLTINPTPATPGITAGGPTTFCAGGSVTLTASGCTGSYLWSPGNQNTTFITVSTSGSYSVTCTENACPSAASVATMVTVNPTPAPPTIMAGGPTTFCAGGSVTLTASGCNGNYLWSPGNQTMQAITVSASGNYSVTCTENACPSAASVATTVTVKPLPTLSNTVPTCAPDLLTYSVSFTSNGTVTSNFGTVSGNTVSGVAAGQNVILTATLDGCPTTLTITAPTCACPPIAAPTSPINQTRCQGQPILALSVSVGSGETVDWYSAPSGGTPLFSGSTSYTPTAAGLFYAQTRNTTTGCLSSTRTAVSLTINPLPTAFSVTGGGSFCTGGAGVAIGLSGSETGVEYQLQNGGTNVGAAVSGTGSALSFGMLTAAGSYMVVTTNSTTTCTAPMTGSVTVTVNPLPAAPTNPVNQTSCEGQPIPALSVSVGSGETVDWYGVSSSGLPLLSTSLNYTPTAAGTFYAETRNTTTGCVSATRTAVSLTINPAATASIAPIPTVCQGSGAIPVSVTLGGSATSGTWTANVGGTFASTTALSTTFTPDGYSASIQFTFETNDPDGPCQSFLATQTVTVNANAVADLGPDATICSNQEYSFPGTSTTGGIFLSTGSGTFTQVSGGITKYTPSAADATAGSVTITYTTPDPDGVPGPCAAVSDQMVLTVNQELVVTVNPAMVICQGGTATITGTYTGNLTSIGNFNDGGTGGTFGTPSISGGTFSFTYTPPAATSNSTVVFYFNVNDPDGTGPCEYLGAVEVSVLIRARPDLVITNPAPVCAPATVDLTAAAITAGSNLQGGTLSYHTDAAGTQPLPNFNAVASSGTYYIKAMASACTDIEPVTVTINPQPTLNSTTPTCAPDLLTYSVSFTSSGTVTSNFGTVNEGVVSGIPANQNIILTATLDGCTTTLNVTAPACNCPPVAAPTAPVDQTICQGQPIPALSVSVGSGETVDWYSAPSGGTLLFSGSTSYTPTAAGTFYAQTRNTTTGCLSSTRTAVTLTIKPVPPAPSVSGPLSFCTGGSTTLTASGCTGSYLWSPGGQNTEAITVTAGGDYSVTCTENNCTSPATSRSVTVNPLPTPVIQAFGPLTFCQGGFVGLGTGTFSSYYWKKGDDGLSNNSSVAVGESGSYTVSVRDANGCDGTSAPIIVTVNPTPATPTITAGGPTTFCAGGSVTLTASACTGSYLWSPGNQTAQAITVSASGNYSVTCTENNCPSAASVATTVTVNPTPTAPTITAGGPTTFCAGESVTLTASGCTGDYLWSPGGQNTTAITVSARGSYSVTCTENSCSSASSAATTVTVKPLPTLSSTGTNCAPNLLTYSVIFTSNGTVTSNFGTVNEGIVSGIAAGQNIILTATLDGCITTLPVTAPACNCLTIAAPTSPVNQTICQGQPIPALSVSVESGETADWYSAPSGGTLLLSTSLNYTPTAAGTFYAQTRNTTTGCLSSTRTAVSLTINPLPTAFNVTGGGSFCAGGMGVALSLSGSQMGVDYQLQNSGANVGAALPGTGSALSFGLVTAAGTYTVVATNSTTACTTPMSGEATVTVNPLPVAPTAPVNQTSCQGQPIPALSVSVGSGETVDWYNAASGGTPLLSGSTSYTPPAAGTYFAQTRNTTTGCVSATRTAVTLTINPIPATPGITAGGPTTFCAGGSVLLTASGCNGSYLWSPGGQNLAAITVSASGSYSVTCTENTCSSASSVATAVTVNPTPAPPTITAGGPTTFCAGESVTLTASGCTGDYLWSPGGQNTTAITVSASGSYSVTCTENSCSSASSAATTVTVKPLPTLSSTGTNCAPNLLTYSVIFTSNGTVTSNFGTVNEGIVSGIAAGQNIILTATLDGCITTLPVTAPACNCPLIAAPTAPVNRVICEGEPIPALSVSVGSGETVDWYDAASGGNLLVSGSLSYTPPAAGTYFAQTRNTTTGCVSSTRTAVTLTFNVLPTITVGTLPTLCAGTTGFSLPYTATSGAPDQYSVSGTGVVSVSNGSLPVSALVISLSSGATPPSVTLSLSVRNSATGCGSAPQTVVVPVNPTLSFSTSKIDVTCNGASTGTLTVIATGGSGNYLAFLNGSNTPQTFTSPYTFTGLAAGPYTVKVKDDLGCETETQPVTITQPNALAFGSPSVTNATCGASNGSFSLTATGGTGTLNYTLSPGGTTNTTGTFAGLAAGDYTVTVTDANACTLTSSSVTVGTVPTVTAAVLSGSALICNGESTNLSVAITGGTGPYVVVYSNGSSNATVNPYTSGSYIPVNPTMTTTYSLVSVTDASGCPGSGLSGNAVVTVNPLPTASISGTTTICSGSGTTISFSGTPNATVSYTVNGNGQSVTLDGNGAASVLTGNLTATTTYALVSASLNGCSQSASGSATVTVISPPTFGFSVQGNGGAMSASSTPNAQLSVNLCPNGSLILSGFSGTTGLKVQEAVTASGATVTYSGTPVGAGTRVLSPGGGQYELPQYFGNTYGPYNLASGSEGTLTQVYTPFFDLNNNNTLDAGDCVGNPITLVITVNAPAAPTITPGGPTTFCAGGSVMLTASGCTGGTYTWSPGNQTTAAITVSATGTYSVTCTKNGCVSASASQPVTVNPLPTPTVSAGGPTTLCTGGSVTLSTGSFSSYVWKKEAAQVGTNPTYSATTSGSYTVTVTDGNGCVGTSSPLTVTVNPLPMPTISGNAGVCVGGTLVLTGTPTGGTWSSDAPGNATVSNVPGSAGQVTGVAAGSVTITYSYTDANGCTGTTTKTIGVTALPTASISGTTTVCYGQSATISFSGTPNATVSYTVNGNPQSVTLNGSGAASVSTGALTANTTYALVRASLNGCLQAVSGSAVVSVTAPIFIGSPVLAANQVICANQTITFSFAVGTCPFPVGNVFTAELSDATGNFGATPTSLGAVTPGSNTVRIPLTTASGTVYRIRVRSSLPAATSPFSPVAFRINALAFNSTPTVNGTPVCVGTTFTISFTTLGNCAFPTGNTFSAELSNASGDFSGGTTSLGGVNPGINNQVLMPPGVEAGTYRIRIIATLPAQVSAPSASFVVRTPSFSITPLVTGAPLCPGQTLRVSFSVSCVFFSGNTFTAQLSDAAGNFGSPVGLGTVSTSALNTLTIPLGTPLGTGYKIRIVSSNPVVTSPVSTAFRVRACTNREAAPEERSLQVVVSPNPSPEGKLRIAISGAEGQRVGVDLYNPTGQPVRQQVIDRAGEEEVLEWDIARQPGGLYLLRVSGAKEARTVKVMH